MEFEKPLLDLVLFVSCNDGVFSEQEESKFTELALSNFPNLNEHVITSWVDQFFEDDLQLEDYCDKIRTVDDKLLALKLAIETAAADGLDVKENLALHKVINYWGISWKDVISA